MARSHQRNLRPWLARWGVDFQAVTPQLEGLIRPVVVVDDETRLAPRQNVTPVAFERITTAAAGVGVHSGSMIRSRAGGGRITLLSFDSATVLAMWLSTTITVATSFDHPVGWFDVEGESKMSTITVNAGDISSHAARVTAWTLSSAGGPHFVVPPSSIFICLMWADNTAADHSYYFEEIPNA